MFLAGSTRWAAAMMLPPSTAQPRCDPHRPLGSGGQHLHHYPDANGGKVEPSALAVVYGQAVGTLPVPTRELYLRRWYDKDGNRYDAPACTASRVTRP